MQYTVNRETLEPVLRFLLRMLVLAAPFYLILQWEPDLSLLQQGNAYLTAEALNLLGVTAEHTGVYVDTATLLLQVSQDSTAWKSFLLYTALVFAVPGVGWRQRVTGIGIGVPVLFCVNVLRIVSMVYAVEMWAVSYTFLHTVMWRWALTGAVAALWGAWLYTVKNLGNKV